MVFTLIVTARQLRPYFQTHTIWVLMDQLLKTVLHRPETFERLVKWSVELSEFDIEYHPRGAIKGQTVTDFITEYTYSPGTKTKTTDEQQETDQAKWVIHVHVDGSSTNSAAKGESSSLRQRRVNSSMPSGLGLRQLTMKPNTSR